MLKRNKNKEELKQKKLEKAMAELDALNQIMLENNRRKLAMMKNGKAW